jgi:hypothetical protein
MELIDKVVEIDQSPIGRTRSNPATYTALFGPIRSVCRSSRIQGTATVDSALMLGGAAAKPARAMGYGVSE